MPQPLFSLLRIKLLRSAEYLKPIKERSVFFSPANQELFPVLGSQSKPFHIAKNDLNKAPRHRRASWEVLCPDSKKRDEVVKEAEIKRKGFHWSGFKK